MPELIGRIVASIYDDSPVPMTGRVIGQVDEETLEVAWGREQDSDYPATHLEFLDELRTVGQ